MEFLKFLIIYALLTISILGYGLIFSKKFTRYNNFENVAVICEIQLLVDSLVDLKKRYA